MKNTLTTTNDINNSASVSLVYGVEFNFTTGYIRITNNATPITINGSIYTNLGELLQISEVAEENEVKSSGVELTIAQVPSFAGNISTADLIMAGGWHGRQFKIYLNWLNGTGAVVQSMLAGQYYIDKMPFLIGEDKFTIKIIGENRLNLWNKPNPRFFTPECDMRIYGGAGAGFKYVAGQVNQTIKWGSA